MSEKQRLEERRKIREIHNARKKYKTTIKTRGLGGGQPTKFLEEINACIDYMLFKNENGVITYHGLKPIKENLMPNNEEPSDHVMLEDTINKYSVVQYNILALKLFFDDFMSGTTQELKTLKQKLESGKKAFNNTKTLTSIIETEHEDNTQKLAECIGWLLGVIDDDKNMAKELIIEHIQNDKELSEEIIKKLGQKMLNDIDSNKSDIKELFKNYKSEKEVIDPSDMTTILNNLEQRYSRIRDKILGKDIICLQENDIHYLLKNDKKFCKVLDSYGYIYQSKSSQEHNIYKNNSISQSPFKKMFKNLNLVCPVRAWRDTNVEPALKDTNTYKYTEINKFYENKYIEEINKKNKNVDINYLMPDGVSIYYDKTKFNALECKSIADPCVVYLKLQEITNDDTKGEIYHVICAHLASGSKDKNVKERLEEIPKIFKQIFDLDVIYKIRAVYNNIDDKTYDESDRIDALDIPEEIFWAYKDIEKEGNLQQMIEFNLKQIKGKVILCMDSNENYDKEIRPRKARETTVPTGAGFNDEAMTLLSLV